MLRGRSGGSFGLGVFALLASCTATYSDPGHGDAGKDGGKGRPEAGPADAGRADTSWLERDLACPGAPACATPCAAGCSLVTLAGDQDNPGSIAKDARFVYFTTYGAGTVMRVPLAGGALATLAAGQNGPKSVSVDAFDLYFANFNQHGIWTGSGAVMRMSLAGGAPVTLVGPGQPNGFMGQKFLDDMVVDATGIYWTTADNGAITGGTVETVRLSGGTPTTLTAGQTFPGKVAVDEAGVYWVTSDAIVTIPKVGGTPTTLARSQYNASGIAVDAANVYWTVTGDGVSCATGAVLSVPKAGGTPRVLATKQDYPTSLAVDDTHVYWTNQVDPGRVMKVATTGGAPETVACGQRIPAAIVVDDTSVYFTNLGSVGVRRSGSVMKRTPK